MKNEKMYLKMMSTVTLRLERRMQMAAMKDEFEKRQRYMKNKEAMPCMHKLRMLNGQRE